MWWIIGLGVMASGFMFLLWEFVNAPLIEEPFTDLHLWEYDDDEDERDDAA